MSDVTYILNTIKQGDSGATYIGRVAETFKLPMENSL
jgi:hypothetical protein